MPDTGQMGTWSIRQRPDGVVGGARSSWKGWLGAYNWMTRTSRCPPCHSRVIRRKEGTCHPALPSKWANGEQAQLWRRWGPTPKYTYRRGGLGWRELSRHGPGLCASTEVGMTAFVGLARKEPNSQCKAAYAAFPPSISSVPLTEDIQTPTHSISPESQALGYTTV